MTAPISVVIPTLNAAPHMQASLEMLMEGLSAGLIRELVISDGGSTDLTLKIADEAGAEIVKGPASRGGQLRRGCATVKGDWILILHADTVLEQGWSKVVAEHLKQHAGRPAHFKLAFASRGVWPGLVACWANLRSAVLGLPYGDQGLLVPTALYRAKGGFPDQPLMEDVEMARRLPDMRTLPAYAITSAERYERDGWIRRGSRNLWTLMRYAMGTDPEKLAAAYRR
ncbi:glycosyltransferase [Epibacterium sp. SM1979]|uniref:Glycosyltransferase n=1 Tax=Tritonibacter litoralis TaxID=2662264 RepID=A0A843YF35_9RHOB|nr:TIGR04283 family arsenosugar biosynthesis glycosyltransferase [Tritonibacter litoralis]MQQ07892.1 glycosyltransferase [Tritonibacter litoralis]